MKNKFRIVLNINNVGYEYSEESIVSCKVSNAKASDISKPNYEVISQTANISLIDRDKNIFYMLKNNTSGVLSIDVYLNNALLGHFISDNINYKYGDSVTRIELSDYMVKLQNFKTPYYKLGGKNESGEGNSYPLSSLISTLFNDTLDIIGDKYVLTIDPFTQNIIDNINLYYGYLEQDTFWNNWNKIARCGLFNIYLVGNKFVIRRVI